MAKDRSRPSLLDLVQDEALAPVRARRTWIDGLDDQIREEVTEVKKQWLAGEPDLTANRMALRIIAALRVLGVETPPNRKTVADWLKS